MKYSRSQFISEFSKFFFAFLVPQILKSETKKYLVDEKIVIVGAGAAGLYAARLLIDKGYAVTIVEAGKVHGGRIRSILTFSDHPVELGAEIILGEKSLYYKLLKNNNIRTYNSILSENFYLCEGKLKDEAEAESDDKFNLIQKVIDNLKTYKGNDINLESFLKNKSIDENYFHIAEALLGNENGSQTSKIGMKSFIKSLNEWSSGNEKYFLTNRSQISALEDICKFKDIPIFYDFAVNYVDYSNDEVILYDKKGRKIQGNKAIITCPINILKKEEIKFVPGLPGEKVAAIDKLTMDSCIKIALKFQKRFWAESTGFIISSGKAPLFRSAGKNRSSNNNVLTAQISGENASELSQMGKGVVQKVVSELDTLFGGKTASNLLVDSIFVDWTREPFIGGGITYPVLNEGNSRENLGKSLKGKLFFAGEATSKEHFGTIQGSLESAIRVVKEITN